MLLPALGLLTDTAFGSWSKLISPHAYAPDGGIHEEGFAPTLLLVDELFEPPFDEVESTNGEDGFAGFSLGRLHGQPFARSYCRAGTVTCVLVLVLLLFFAPKVFASTIQLPAMCLNGLGIWIPAWYEPKQIATPTPIVNVGET